MQDQQHAGEVREEGPVRARAAPLPEVVRAFARRGRKGVLEGLVRVRGRCAVREGDVQEQDLHEDGEQRLDEERGAEVRAEPVEDSPIESQHVKQMDAWDELLQNTGDQHDQRNVQRKAGAAACLVDRVDLVRIAGDWAGRNEHRRDVLDYGIETEHGVCGGTRMCCGLPACFDARTPRECRNEQIERGGVDSAAGSGKLSRRVRSPMAVCGVWTRDTDQGDAVNTQKGESSFASLRNLSCGLSMRGALAAAELNLI